MKKTSILVLVVALVLLLVGGGYLYSTLSKGADMGNLTQTPKQDMQPDAAQTPDAQPEPEYDAAPDITVYDAAGNTHMLSDYLGTPVVLNFWASWCPPCKSEMPDFDKVAAALDGEVMFMMVNATDGARETQATAQAFLDEQSFTFPVFFDLETTALQTYSIMYFPSTFFINAEGHLVAKAEGMIDEETLLSAIESLGVDVENVT